jgi:hypothetical protein
MKRRRKLLRQNQTDQTEGKTRPWSARKHPPDVTMANRDLLGQGRVSNARIFPPPEFVGLSSLAEERIGDGGSHREHTGPHDELPPSAPPMNTRSRDPASSEIGVGCDGGRRSAIGGPDWKLSKPFDADHGYHLPGFVGSLATWPRRTKPKNRVSRPLTDPCCAIGDSSAAESDVPWWSDANRSDRQHERLARNRADDWSA